MKLVFDRGNPQEPKGHALVYFNSAADPAQILATYIVVPPIPINLAKYMPPIFASQAALSSLESFSPIPLPPLPESVESYEYLQNLAAARGDDLLYAGAVNSSEPQAMLHATGEAAQAYSQMYREYAQALLSQKAAQPEVSEVLYRLMGEQSKIEELAKLTGKLRYAVDGNDRSLIEEAVREIEGLAQYLPEKYRIKDFLAAAKLPGEKGRKLSELYIQRCYKICQEDYRELGSIERQIKEWEASAR